MGIRVLFITRAYPPVVGGMEKVSYELTTHLSALAQAHIIANRGGKKSLPFFLPYALFRALYLIRRHRIQLVHLSDGFMSLLGVVIKFLCKIPVLVTVHGLDVIYPQATYQWLIPKCLKRMDKIICISRHTRQECLKRGIDSGCCLFIPNGVNGQEFILHEPNLRLQLEQFLGTGLAGKRVLLSVGHLVRRKGVSWFIKSVMPKLPPDIIYVVIGGYGNASIGDEEQQYRGLIGELGLQQRVFLLGEVPLRVLKIAYNTADLLIMPNIRVNGDMEGFGLVVLEAGSCGLPALAANLEGIKDALCDGRNGFLVRTGDAADYIGRINGYQPTAEFCRQVRDFTLARFEWAGIAKRYYQVFRKVLSQ